MSNPPLVTIELTHPERAFLRFAITSWSDGPGSSGPFPVSILGVASWDELDAMIRRLDAALKRGEPMTDLDWARALFLAEINWASDLVGTGTEFAIVMWPDDECIKLLRSLQRKIMTGQRADLLFPGARRPKVGEP